jgi:hypothetical protein
MLSRSLETLSIRMEKADANARIVADYLRDHAKVAKVHYLAHLDENTPAGLLFNDALGRSCLYVPIRQDGRVVDSLGHALDLERTANERTDGLGKSANLGHRNSRSPGLTGRGIPCVPRHHHRLLRLEQQPAK